MRACETGQLLQLRTKRVSPVKAFCQHLSVFSPALCLQGSAATVYSQVSPISSERDLSSSHLHDHHLQLFAPSVTLAALGALRKGTAGIRSGTKSRKIPTLSTVRRTRRILQRLSSLRKWRRTWGLHAGGEVGGSQCPCDTLATDHRSTQNHLLQPHQAAVCSGCHQESASLRPRDSWSGSWRSW